MYVRADCQGDELLQLESAVQGRERRNAFDGIEGGYP